MEEEAALQSMDVRMEV
jgi:hypothetical protein